jgi:hypothetical protein
VKLLAALILAALMASLSHAESLSFGLFGDTPYNHWERQHLPELIGEMATSKVAQANAATRPSSTSWASSKIRSTR